MEKRDFLFVGVDGNRVRKIPPPQNPSTSICKIVQNFVTPSSLFADVINE